MHWASFFAGIGAAIAVSGAYVVWLIAVSEYLDWRDNQSCK